MKVLITGASGFLGRVVTKCLSQEYDVICPIRTPLADCVNAEVIITGDYRKYQYWPQLLESVDAVVHLAGLAHRFGISQDLNLQHDKVNREFTLLLAEAARQVGVKKFLYVSSVSVYGQISSSVPLPESHPPSPDTPYAASKHEAERYLLKDSGLEVVVLRPPIIFGPGARGNLGALISRIDSQGLLPIGLAKNKRSWVSAADVASLISTALNKPSAVGEIFHVAAFPPLSSLEAARALAIGMDKELKVLKVPPHLLSSALSVIGKGSVAHKLFSDLVLDHTKAQRLLGWTASVSPLDGLFEVGRAWQSFPWEI